MALNHIIGQKKTIEMLYGILKRRRIASSYLFCGESGVGKKTTAINFAKALNCKYAGGMSQQTEGLIPDFIPAPERIDACDSCDSCSKIETRTHPDFLFVSPEERQIRIEEIRMIDDALSMKPFEADKKIVIVDEADAMNISAANAFLKTLEEPPGESVIILISSRPELLPETIRSRCSRINFSPLSPESCRTVLEGKIPGNNIDLVTRLSMGRPGIALSADLLEERTWFLDLFNSMMKAEKDGWTSREDMELWFDHALTLLRDMTVLTINSDPSSLVNTDLKEYLSKLSKSLDAKVIINVYAELYRVKELLSFNLNKSITWNCTSSFLRRELAAENA